jgi:DNA-binding NtrC family response regulator
MAKNSRKATDKSLLPLPLSGLDILLVEDEVLVASDVEDLLRQEGARSVETTAFRRIAREVAALRPFSVALVDIKLADGSGLDLLPDFHQAGIPVVITTGYSGVDAGKWPVVEKPYSAVRLINAILDVVRRAGSAAG